MVILSLHDTFQWDYSEEAVLPHDWHRYFVFVLQYVSNYRNRRRTIKQAVQLSRPTVHKKINNKAHFLENKENC